MRVSIILWLTLAGWLHGAGLTFTETEKELKAETESRQVAADFAFTNKTDKPLTISRYDGGCTCATVQISGGKLRYGPGESGVVRAIFDIGNFSGTQEKVVALWLEGAPDAEPSHRLKLRIHIPVLVEMEPKTLKWDIGAAAEPQKIAIRMHDDKPIHVLSVSSTLENFKLDLKTIEKGQHYELTVTPDGTEQPALAIFRVETDCDVARHKVGQVFGVIRKPLPSEISPAP